ncbi:MAG TPA: Coenzyme F420 hydrogenase/dehydrogenase, beta subunit C-terminal domain [Pseudobacteroides sp.]|uniref:Coenzyme F420 hydrogenase/dehydrogenase, beta subunit C-terminal domain n=1 Tax=Pseudobacteroides sp. TaxID=1968840 RepID=UPI002F940BC1
MKKIVLFENKKDCCACGACFNICSQNAIDIVEDEYGFTFPRIKESLCVKCGACKKVCAFQNIEEVNEPIVTYVAVSQNTDIKKSASGGMFASFGKSIIENGGVIYGVSLERIDDIMTPIHIGIDNLDDLEKLQGSKYVQSFIGHIYSEIKDQLNTGRMVLFSGTPCQVGGLKGYLGNKSYENLLLIDIICHGIPSAKLFQSYINTLEKKIKGKIVDFIFRDKTIGWGHGSFTYVGKFIYVKRNKKYSEILPSAESSYYQAFLKSQIFRESCYSCKYACRNRPGDISIGDFWGVQKEHSELLIANGGAINEANGVSCVIINTENGKKYFDKFKKGVCFFQSDFEKAAHGNAQLNYPSLMNIERHSILELFKKNGYEAVEKRFRKTEGYRLYIRKLKNRLPKQLKNQIKYFFKRR